MWTIWKFISLIIPISRVVDGEGGGDGGESTEGEKGGTDDGGEGGDGKDENNDDSSGKDGDGDNKGGDEPKEDPPPEDYELTLEKDSLLNDKNLKAASEYAKGKKLSEKDAKELLELQEDAVGEHLEKQQNDHKAKTAAWKKEIEARKEFKEERVLVNQAMEKFGSPELKEALEKSGFTNWPLLFDTFKNIGKAMSDDTWERGGTPPKDKDVSKMSAGDAMYPDMK